MQIRETIFYKIYHYIHLVCNKKILKYKSNLVEELMRKTNYRERFITYKDKHVNERRCFLVGNGPSLRAVDLDKLKDEITFSTNKIYKIFNKTEWRPYYYIVDDSKYVKKVNINSNIPSQTTFIGIEDNPKLIKKYMNTNALVFRKITQIVNGRPQISKDFAQYLGSGYTVLFPAFQLAVLMGFKEIYLIGCDCSFLNNASGNWFYENTEQLKVSKNDETNIIRAWMSVKDYAENHNIKVYNATRGGALEIFERVDFNDLFIEERKGN